jgi:hypothetical protein
MHRINNRILASGEWVNYVSILDVARYPGLDNERH